MRNEKNMKKTLKTLEFNKILEILEIAVTDSGKELCRNLIPSSDIETITRNTDYTNIAETLVYKTFRILQNL